MYPKLSFAGITGLIAWAGNNHTKFLCNDEMLPFVEKDKQYWYFAWKGTRFDLVMVSSRDLNVKN